MRILNRLKSNSRLAPALVLVALLALPGCSVNVKKDAEGKEKNVDIETPVGGLHVATNVDPRDTGLPVYPGARQKQQSKDSGDENSAHVNISTSLFGVKVAAIEYLSDDPPEKLIPYYKDQLKKYGTVLECHTNNMNTGATATFSDKDKDKGDDSKLKCDDNNGGNTIELKVGTQQNQHVVSIRPGDGGKGSDFALVYVQLRGGKDTI